jgi:hypothetical protein
MEVEIGPILIISWHRQFIIFEGIVAAIVEVDGTSTLLLFFLVTVGFGSVYAHLD